MSEFYKETQSIFGEERDVAGTDHNVGDLLMDLKAKDRAIVNGHYSTRSGLNNYNAARIGAVTETPTARLEKHASYLGHTYEKPFKVYTPDELQAISANLQPGEPKPLVVPYFRSQAITEKYDRLGVDTWGLPPTLGETLKNKVSFHELVTQAGIEGFEVPEYRIANGDNYHEQAFDLLKYSQKLYEDTGMTDRYPLGLVVRLENADGGFGSSYLVQKGKTIIVSPDGSTTGEDVKKITIASDSPHAWETAWKKAINNSWAQITEKAQDNPQVVISRRLELAKGEGSPGMSMVFMNGEYYSLGWNGQLQLNGSKAAVGTSSYRPNSDYLKNMQATYEARSAELAAAFMFYVAKTKGIAREDINGFAGYDFMIPGELEAQLQQARGKEFTIYGAEINPRPTNYTDATGAAMGARGMAPTVSNMRTIITDGIYTEDKVDLGIPLIDKNDPDELKARKQQLIDNIVDSVRNIVQSQDSRSKADRVLVRMPDAPMGAIYLGNKDAARGELKQAIGEAQKLHQATIEEVIFVNKTCEK